jgi:hypothetical protein
MMTTKELSYKVMTNAHMVLWTRCAKNGGNVQNKNSTKGYHRVRHRYCIGAYGFLTLWVWQLWMLLYNKDAIMLDRIVNVVYNTNTKLNNNILLL